MTLKEAMGYRGENADNPGGEDRHPCRRGAQMDGRKRHAADLGSENAAAGCRTGRRGADH